MKMIMVLILASTAGSCASTQKIPEVVLNQAAEPEPKPTLEPTKPPDGPQAHPAANVRATVVKSGSHILDTIVDEDLDNAGMYACENMGADSSASNYVENITTLADALNDADIETKPEEAATFLNSMLTEYCPDVETSILQSLSTPMKGSL